MLTNSLKQMSEGMALSNAEEKENLIALQVRLIINDAKVKLSQRIPDAMVLRYQPNSYVPKLNAKN
jgi:hypothetical protein